MDPMAGLMSTAATPAGAPATVTSTGLSFQGVYSSIDTPLVNAVNWGA